MIQNHIIRQLFILWSSKYEEIKTEKKTKGTSTLLYIHKNKLKPNVNSVAFCRMNPSTLLNFAPINERVKSNTTCKNR